VHDLACIVHCHSLYSDGTGTVPEIARAARRAAADAVLLTDHDTLAAKDRGEEGWHDGVLVLVGHEVSPRRRDHYLAFGLDETIDHADRSSTEICEAVRAGGGFGFAAHPFSRGSARFRRMPGMAFGDLECDALHGIELWSFANDTGEQLASIPQVLHFIARPGHVLRHPPERNVRAWDRLCATRRVVAIGGVDAHQFGKRVGPFVPLRLMSYRRSFRHVRTHVLTDEPPTGALEHDREQVYEALRAGRCYIAVDSVAPPGGFSFHAEGPGGRLEMGAEAEAGDWTLHARLPAAARVRLVRDGERIAELESARLERPATEPGVYRVEALRKARGAERTWILSNPIYLRGRP
jgi:hypothetical protein